MTETNAVVHFGGMPTEPEVKILMGLFGEIPAGGVIEYSAIESAIGTNRKTNRFRTVTYAFRSRMLREKNVELRPLAGIGLRRLDESERVTCGVDGISKGARAIRVSGRRLMLVEAARLSEIDLRKRDHGIRLAEVTDKSLRSGLKQIAQSALNPQPLLPRMGGES